MMLIPERTSLCEEFARQYPVAALLFALAIIAFIVAAVVLGIEVHKRKIFYGKEAMPGRSGKALTDLEPGEEGKVFLRGEIWNAVSDEKIHAGEKILVTKIEDFTLRVTGKR